MDEALAIVQNWCRTRGLMVNPTKTSAMIFTRKYKPEPIETLRLWGKEINYVNSVKYLGVLLDPKLSWKPHLEEKRKKFYTSMWACRRAMGKNWGLNLRTALWLYKMVLLPRLTYAAVVWWLRAEKVEARNLLKSLQGGYLRAAAGAMNTAPTEALQIALSIPPLNQVIKYTARQTAYRLRCQGEWKETRTGHTRLGLSNRHPFNLKQDRIPRRHQLVKNFKVQIPTREDWSKHDYKANPDVDTWFTDGSGANGRYGAGIYGPNINHKVSIPMGELATVFQAEVLAIQKCAELLLKGKSRKQINIYTDSRAAIEALARTSTESSVVWDCMQALTTLGATNKVTLVWVPGHQGIPGNEGADELAKQGTEKAPAERIVGVPFSAGTKIIKEWLEREHSNSWKGAEGCKRAKQLMRSPNLARTRELLAMGKTKLRSGIGLLTGHLPLRAHLFNLRLAEQKECRLCGEESEDNLHLLCRCPALACKRYKSWGQFISWGYVYDTQGF
ncbi:PREDICTED: uncharacterized protein LOC108775154 [Cyphomyrmex costatus]|uniref:uncharacterized protein LOC108775154 n=1 Tax=Cyphomyrmex costatus TaxID=456900 RepID=UPI0008522F1C|nr:PREDICTED: uncharacterized protein LOC108775154 [Cyphomyrmex costatus]